MAFDPQAAANLDRKRRGAAGSCGSARRFGHSSRRGRAAVRRRGRALRLPQPLIWADELASTLFVWLSALGAVLAMRRNAHMRLTAFISRAGPALRQKIEVIILLVVAAFVLILAYPAIEYSIDEAIVRTPGLDISNSWRASAVAVGAVLIAIFSLLRLLVISPSRDIPGGGGRHRCRCLRGAVVGAPALHGARQLQSADLLRARRRRGGGGGRADRLRLRHRHRRLCGAGDAGTADRDRQPHGRGHVAPAAAVDPAVRPARHPDRHDRHGEGDGGLPGIAARPCSRRPVLCAARRDVSGVRHIGRQGRRHGGGGARSCFRR